MATESKENGSERFKLPGSSLEEVFKVVQGYTTLGKASSLSSVAKNTGMHETSISRNVGFLLSIGVLQGGRDKSATEIGNKLGLALMHNMQDELQGILANIVAENEFLRNVLAAVRIRKGMDESSLRAHIAYSAGHSKTGSTTAGTGAIVEFLKRSGNLKIEDGKLVTSSPVVRSAVVSSDVVSLSPQDKIERAASQIISQKMETTSPFVISIKIEVSCRPDEMDDLGLKLRKIVDDFANSGGSRNISEE